MTKEKYVYFNTSDKASLTIVPAGSDTLVFTAVETESGVANDISVQVRHDDAAGTITVTDRAIVIGVGGGADKGADDIATAYAVDAAGPNAARALATLAVTGTAHVAADLDTGVQYLSSSDVMYPLSSFAGMAPGATGTLLLYFKSLRNYDGQVSLSNGVVISDVVTLTLATNQTHKDVMQSICDRFASAQGGYGFIVIGDDADGSVESAITGLNASNPIGTLTIAATNADS
tara:strand:- start:438 stop:1133 length:696 start_codon:yes stop_codon:yes gene_type:complete